MNSFKMVEEDILAERLSGLLSAAEACQPVRDRRVRATARVRMHSADVRALEVMLAPSVEKMTKLKAFKARGCIHGS